MPLRVLLILPFDGILLWVKIYFLGAIGIREEAFCERFSVEWEGDFECGLKSQ